MIDGLRVVAVIPARGGSKRLLRKNIYPVCGQPMLSWSIQAAQRSKYIDEVYVTSEDEEILSVAKDFGAKTIVRPLKLADDMTYKQEAICHAVYEIGCPVPGIVISVQANSPQMNPKDLDEALEKFIKFDRHEIFSVDNDLIMNAAFRIMRYGYVFQQTLSTNSGVFVADYIDVHTIEDIGAVEEKMGNHWEKAIYKKKGETIESNYLNDELKLINTKEMLDYVDSRADIKGNVLELGCSLARNLREAHKRYKCHVVGVDINQESIDKDIEYFKDDGAFFKRDLLNPDNLKSFNYPDKHFSLGISMGFLMHIPPSEKKDQLIKEFIRICEHVCIFELYDESRDTVFRDNKWSVSFEDYRQYDEQLELTNVYGCQTKERKDKNFVLFYK
jgi:SAM-dependent methyltransferase